MNTSSASGLFGSFGQSAYSAAKMAIAGFTKTLALEGARYGIAVNAIAPGALTRMTGDVLGAGSPAAESFGWRGEELEARIGRAYAAATRADLRPLLADLPAILGRRPRPRAHDAHAWQVWASVAIVLLVVWAATGAGTFWPVWPLGFWALGLMLGHGAPRHHWERPRV